MITYFQALILGLVQGIAEFLPVSSTAHMRILPALIHRYNPSWPNDPGAAFSAVVQLGPIVAIIAYFHKDLLRYLAGLGRSLQARMLFPKGTRTPGWAGTSSSARSRSSSPGWRWRRKLTTSTAT